MNAIWTIAVAVKALLNSLLRCEFDLHHAIMDGEPPMEAIERLKPRLEGAIEDGLQHAYDSGYHDGVEVGFAGGSAEAKGTFGGTLKRDCTAARDAGYEEGVLDGKEEGYAMAVADGQEQVGRVRCQNDQLVRELTEARAALADAEADAASNAEAARVQTAELACILEHRAADIEAARDEATEAAMEAMAEQIAEERQEAFDEGEEQGRSEAEEEQEDAIDEAREEGVEQGIRETLAALDEAAGHVCSRHGLYRR